ncbi:MAG: GTPase ObgE [FCB group bacterium]|nr:GTPase ObgE [FCB group bacterium]
MFIDVTEIQLIAGNGGPGAVSFRREKFIPKGGPDGGDGGRGGHIYLKVDPHLRTLQDIPYRRVYRARNGGHGQGSRKFGADGHDITIKVPPGTQVYSLEKEQVIADLVAGDQEFLVCRGGKGGRGNVHFKSSTHQTPRYAQPGLPGESGTFRLELKLLADVGLVGLPNSGKSTLLSTLSNARPKVANYPFTTLNPNLGIVKYGPYASFVCADIPGLIEGASRGKGLGHQFLRHIERTSVLVFLIDCLTPEPDETLRLLQNELKAFNPHLLKKPQIWVRSKIDLIGPDDSRDVEGYLSISSHSGEGLDTLIKSIVPYLNEQSGATP